MIGRCPFVAAVPISLVGRRENERAERDKRNRRTAAQERALERLRDAKRVYEKTTEGRARDASQNYITPSGLQRLKD
jgi:hypothetical protein